MKKLCKSKIYGMVTVGERGQVVIPVQLRKLFGVGPGDKLVVFAKSHMFSFIAADEFNRFVSDLSKAALILGKKRRKRS